MKTTVKGAIRDEKGAVLIMVLILLVVGGLILTPLLGLMSTGLLAGKVYEKKMDEYYAADAGVEDAIWRIQGNNLTFGTSNSSGPWKLTVNGKNVTVEVYGEDPYQTQCGENSTYRTYHILSTAITNYSGGTAAISGTQIEAYVTGIPSDYSSITDYILCSQGELDWGNKVTLNYTEGHGPEDYYEDYWPTSEELAQFYWQYIEDEIHYLVDTEIDLQGNSCPPGPIYINDIENNSWPSGLGPLYINGELDIINSSNDEATLSLNGTLYITGNTLIGQNGKNTLNIDLNGQTIFVESSSADAIIVGSKCTIKGPGAIIAVGDVYFAPKGDVGSNGEPVFILSITGTTKLQPSGDFYGAIAGSVWVDVQQGHTPTITYPPGGFEDDDLNFPGFGDFQQLVYSIASWEISGV